MQNTITSYLIKDALAGREGLTFKMMEEGEIVSYMLATENNDEGRKEVYIADFASKRNHPKHSIRMMRNFLKKYLRQYENDIMLPPFREKTSYRFIKNENKFNKMLKRYGLRAKVIEAGTDVRGRETFHNCVIFFIRSNEDKSKFDEMIKQYSVARHKR